MVLATGIKRHVQAALWPLQVLYRVNQTGLWSLVKIASSQMGPGSKYHRVTKYFLQIFK